MNIKNILLLACFCSLEVIAQHKIGVGLTISPELSCMKKESYTTYFAPAQTSGLIVSYDINRRIGISSGLWYSTKVYYEQYNRIDSDGNLQENVKNYTSINYVEIPALLNLKACDSSKVGFYSSIGPVLGIPVSAYSKDNPDVGYNHSTYNSSINTILSAYVGIGASVTFSEKWLLLIEPNATRSLTPLYNSDSYSLSKYFYSFGIRFSMLYKL